MTKRISFEVLEPLMFKSTSEFAPGVSGPHAHAESIPLPYPSTAAGTLSSLVLEGMAQRILPTGGWDEQMSNLIGSEAMLRGPYVLSDDDRIFVQCETAVLEWEEALKLAQTKLQETYNEGEAKENVIESVDVVGVKLKDGRATEEEMLYFARMVDYSPMGKQKAICFDLVGDSKNIERISFPKIVKFGGEGRASRVSIFESDSTLVSLIKKNAEKANALYVASPVVFKTGLSYDGNLEEKLRQLVRDALGGIDVTRIVGKVDLLGMGFLTAKVQRKPIYGAIFPGSVIQLGNQSVMNKEICERGIGEFSKLGYGTVIPFS